MKFKAALSGLLFAVILVSGPAQASLIDRGNGLVYDEDLNITWMADAHFAAGTGFFNSGMYDWYGARDWAANLIYGGYSDWRLPTTKRIETACVVSRKNCSGDELSHLMFIEFGLVFGRDSFANSHSSLFKDIQFNGYWSGTSEYGSETDLFAFEFSSWGYANVSLKSNRYYDVWAVRDGDVAAVSIPEPGSLALIGLALSGLAVSRRKYIKAS